MCCSIFCNWCCPCCLGAAAGQATSIAGAPDSGGNWGGAGNNTWTLTAAGSVVPAGGANVTMRYGQGSPDVNNTANIVVASPVHLNAGSTYTTRLGSHGAIINNTIITIDARPKWPDGFDAMVATGGCAPRAWLPLRLACP